MPAAREEHSSTHSSEDVWHISPTKKEEEKKGGLQETIVTGGWSAPAVREIWGLGNT